MNAFNGYSRRSWMDLIFASVDSLLIVTGVFVGGILRFGWEETNFLGDGHFVWKLMMIILVIQTVFYYFDLYELRNFQQRMKTLIYILGALGISSIILAVIYYSIPSLTIGRGILTLSLLIIFLFAFLWRLFYLWVTKKVVFKERILIIGTGELAKSIQKEILENGQDSFEIVGFVDERRERVGESI